MTRVMPTQVVQTIDQLFPHAKQNARGTTLSGHSATLLGVLMLVNDVPGELINLPPADYADLILARSTIEDTRESTSYGMALTPSQ
jgi:hypothetical protein